MAGDEETGSVARPQPQGTPPEQGQDKPAFGIPRPLHREPRVIAGEAVRVPDPQGESANADAAAGDAPVSGAGASSEVPEEALLREQADEEAAAQASAKDAPVQGSRGLLPLTLLLAALLGLAGGFAGAYGARLWFDDKQDTLAAIDTHLTSLDTRLAADEKKTDTGIGQNRDALSGLQKRLAGVESSLKDALAVAATAGQQEQSEPHAAPAAGEAQQPVAAAAPPPDLSPLEARLDALEQRLSGLDGLEQRVAGLDALEQRVARIDALDQRLSQMESVLDAPKVVTRAPEEPVAKPDPEDANAPAVAIIAENLVQKVSGGAAFASETTALENLGVDKAKLADLQPYATKGIVPPDALAKQFAALAPSLKTSHGEPAEGSIFERWMQHAAGLVRIRKVDDLSGDDAPSRVARIQDALGHADLDRALQEWSALPDDVKTKSADWAQSASASAKAIGTAKAISSETIARLTKLKS